MKINRVGKVLNLFISQNGVKNRIKQNGINLDKNGILKDKFYNKNIQRSVLIVSKDSYDLAKKNNIDIDYGQLGENILIDYNPYHLKIGSKIKIGDVILQISQECTLCKSLSKVNKNLPELLKDDRGVFAKVIVAGAIKDDDIVSLFTFSL